MIKRVIFASLILAGVAGFAIASQDTDITNRQVRDPLQLETYLEANATDAETRLAASEDGKASSATIANGAGISTQTVAKAVYVLEPSAVHTQRFAAASAVRLVTIKNNAATNVFIDVAAGDVTLGDNDCVTLGYIGSEWITVSTKDN